MTAKRFEVRISAHKNIKVDIESDGHKIPERPETAFHAFKPWLVYGPSNAMPQAHGPTEIVIENIKLDCTAVLAVE